MIEYDDLQKSLTNEISANILLMHDLLKKSYQLIEQTQELINSSWGWLGADLDE